MREKRELSAEVGQIKNQIEKYVADLDDIRVSFVAAGNSIEQFAQDIEVEFDGAKFKVKLPDINIPDSDRLHDLLKRKIKEVVGRDDVDII